MNVKTVIGKNSMLDLFKVENHKLSWTNMWKIRSKHFTGRSISKVESQKFNR